MKWTAAASLLFVTLMSNTAVSSPEHDSHPHSTPSPKGSKVYIVSPSDGAVVDSPFTVVFGLSGMGVAPAGADLENTGHHHLLIDQPVPADLTKPLGQDIKHFGGGQTQETLDLPPGKHTLQLILGDRYHVPFNPPLISRKVTITVQ